MRWGGGERGEMEKKSRLYIGGTEDINSESGGERAGQGGMWLIWYWNESHKMDEKRGIKEKWRAGASGH